MEQRIVQMSFQTDYEQARQSSSTRGGAHNTLPNLRSNKSCPNYSLRLLLYGRCNHRERAFLQN